MMNIEQLAIEHGVLKLHERKSEGFVYVAGDNLNFTRLEAFAKALQQQSELAAGGKEFAWLVEKDINGFPNYLFCDCIGILSWAPSNAKALRFARREDAESMVSIVEDSDRIAQHVWSHAMGMLAPQQTGGPVAWMTKRDDVISEFGGVAITNSHKKSLVAAGQTLGDLFDIPLYTQPPNTVSLEQYNKLLDALKSVKSKTSDMHSNENATHLINRLLAVRHIVDFSIVEAERDDE